MLNVDRTDTADDSCLANSGIPQHITAVNHLVLRHTEHTAEQGERCHVSTSLMPCTCHLL